MFCNASNANELSKHLCNVLCIGYEILKDIPAVLCKMKRIGVIVHFVLLENIQQLMSDSDNTEDLRNHKFLVVMGDGSKYIVTFELYHHHTDTCHNQKT